MPHVVPGRLSIHVMVVVAAIGCGDVADPTQPAGFVVLDGAVDGVAPPGAEVRVLFRVVDGSADRGVPVSFVVVEGGGSVFAGSSPTNQHGEVRDPGGGEYHPMMDARA